MTIDAIIFDLNSGLNKPVTVKDMVNGTKFIAEVLKAGQVCFFL
jgi:hypothetical protein